MKQRIVGILAHVDAGKTTLSEAMLFESGQLKKLGRVDHQDAFLDTFALERARGITIFSKQAILPVEDGEITLLDTPGHMDFSAEMERTLQVLDYAILVISGSDGIQAHTRTLWRLLQKYQVPSFLFVNKMDIAGADHKVMMQMLCKNFGDGCIDFSQDRQSEKFMESVAMCDETVLNRYFESGFVKDGDITRLIAKRKLFPCFFGSALKLLGIDELLEAMARYAALPSYPAEFGARVYKIARDVQGTRLTYLKITGGALRVKDVLRGVRIVNGEENAWEEKVDQIRVYSGQKFTAVDQLGAGNVCAIAGLSQTFVGQGLGHEAGSTEAMLEPIMTYRVVLPRGYVAATAFAQLQLLEEEDPQLHVEWSEQLREIHVQIMGAIQLEILKELLLERFGLAVEFDAGSILYKETIANAVEGVGHFEPLRHYAEAHILLEPGELGSGLTYATACSEDELDGSWQRLILTHLKERVHPGVLTRSPITDMRMTLVAGRGHLKHTEGGDFREATYRAVRQGLMQAESILLEPWYDFRLEIPANQMGRAMSDLQRMSANLDAPQIDGEEATLTGTVPVSLLQDYAMEVTAYTKGLGHLSCALKGYMPCHNQAEVVAKRAYDPERDVMNTPNSVFCSHGAGFVVRWNQVKNHMHVDSGLRLGMNMKSTQTAVQVPSVSGAHASDDELMAIYERTYGKVEPRSFRPQATRDVAADGEAVKVEEIQPEYLLVDGYNLIFAWKELNAVASDSLDSARQLLADMLSNYQGYKKNHVILVFDAYKVQRHKEDIIKYQNIHVVYTKEAETADSYIEKTSFELGKKYRVKVVTSDYMQQLIILGHGALRISSREFIEEMGQMSLQIEEIMQRINRNTKSYAIKEAMEKAQKQKGES